MCGRKQPPPLPLTRFPFWTAHLTVSLSHSLRQQSTNMAQATPPNETMYSPQEAVHGYDRTYVKRMSLAEYLDEIDAEERDLRGEEMPTATVIPQYELRRAALSSRDPNVSFSSRFPMYDRLGRELCVLYQIQAQSLSQECYRLQHHGDASRRSGVRLSAELRLGTAASNVLSVAATRKDLDENENTVAALSVSRTPFYPSQSTSARPSEFSIYQDSNLSGRRELQSSTHGGAGQAATPLQEVAAEPDAEKILVTEHPTTAIGSCEDLQTENGAKRARSRCSAPRLSRVRFADAPPHPEPLDAEIQEGLTVRTPTPPPPLPAFAPTRASAAVRATKQLFRATTAGRPTTVQAYANPIPTSLYGIESTTILASVVRDAVEESLLRTASLRDAFEEHPTAPTPELRCGQSIELGGRWWLPVNFFVAAEVYEVVEIPAPPTAAPTQSQKSIEEEGLELTPAASPQAASRCLVNPLPTDVPPLRNGETKTAEAEVTQAIPAAEQGTDSLAVNRSVVPPATAHDAAPLHPDAPQRLLYRWRSSPHAGNEARRAALGLSLAGTAEVTVNGYTYSDGGLTLLTLPAGHRVVPASGLPLTTASYIALLKLVLKMLSALVARRTVHGSLTTLGDLLIAYPPEAGAVVGGATCGGGQQQPLLLPVHWERAVDFSMFADRNAGRTLPYNCEDGSDQPQLTIGADVASVLQAFLRNTLSSELSSEQYIPLQRLLLMTTEPTQVANYLVVTNNLMGLLASQPQVLRLAYEAAIVLYHPTG